MQEPAYTSIRSVTSLNNHIKALRPSIRFPTVRLISVILIFTHKRLELKLLHISRLSLCRTMPSSMPIWYVLSTTIIRFDGVLAFVGC